MIAEKVILCLVLGLDAAADIRRREIPVLPTVLAGGLMAAELVIRGSRSLPALLCGLLPGAALLLLSLAAKERIGAGDGIALLCCGCVLDFFQLCPALRAFLAAGLFGLVLARKRKTRRISLPFVPFLAGAVILVLSLEGIFYV